jgi:hypothetical protein
MLQVTGKLPFGANLFSSKYSFPTSMLARATISSLFCSFVFRADALSAVRAMSNSRDQSF